MSNDTTNSEQSNDEITPPDFLTIPTVLLKDIDLKPSDPYVYAAVLWFYSMTKPGNCYASNATIAKIAGLSASSVADALTRLDRGDYIRRQNKGGRRKIVPMLTFGVDQHTPSSDLLRKISCHYCGKSGFQNMLQKEHYIPKSKGGTNKKDNLVLACSDCNQEKGAMTGDDFIELLKEEGRYLRNLPQLRNHPSSTEEPIKKRKSNQKEKKRTKATKNNIKEKRIKKKKKWFDEFWEAYPRKVSKQDAKDRFIKTVEDKEHFHAIMDALREQKQTTQWQKNDGQYVPYPTTWINQGRWEDDPEAYNYEEDDKETGVAVKSY